MDGTLLDGNAVWYDHFLSFLSMTTESTPRIRPHKTPDQMRGFVIDPLVDGFCRDGRKLLPCTLKASGNKFRGPPQEEMGLDFKAQNSAF